jgi:hypothetical protein
MSPKIKDTCRAPRLSHFAAKCDSYFRISFAFFRIIVAFFAFLLHPFPAITAYITCPYVRFPVSRLSHFSHFPAELVPPSAGLVPPSAGWPPPREKTKSEKRKIKIPLFLVFRSPAHRTMFPSTHDSVCAWRSISRQLASVKDFLENFLGNPPEAGKPQTCAPMAHFADYTDDVSASRCSLSGLHRLAMEERRTIGGKVFLFFVFDFLSPQRPARRRGSAEGRDVPDHIGALAKGGRKGRKDSLLSPAHVFDCSPRSGAADGRR